MLDNELEELVKTINDALFNWDGQGDSARFVGAAILASGFRRTEESESSADLCEWCDMTARGNAMHPGHDGSRRSCGEEYHGEGFEPDAETPGESSSDVQSLRAELAAMTAEKEKWRVRCAEETIAWADEATDNRRLHAEPQGEPSDARVDAGAEAILQWHHPRQKLADYPPDIQEGLREQARAALRATGTVAEEPDVEYRISDGEFIHYTSSKSRADRAVSKGLDVWWRTPKREATAWVPVKQEGADQ